MGQLKRASFDVEGYTAEEINTAALERAKSVFPKADRLDLEFEPAEPAPDQELGRFRWSARVHVTVI